MKTSVIIPHSNRKNNLFNTLLGLNRQSVVPTEVLVVDFDLDLEFTTDYKFDLRIISYTKSWKHLPVAAARNLGVIHSKYDHLIFLDVDCIPNPSFIEHLTNIEPNRKALVMAEPHYLTKPIDNQWTFEELESLSIPHHKRPEIKEMILEKNYALFWSLCFHLSKSTFELLEGFDENYTGYGIEDTDFAFKTERQNIPFYLHPTHVFHQQHQLYRPPLNQLEAIVDNCNVFFEKWRTWPVPKILNAFTDMGYIRWTSQESTPIDIESRPTPEEMEHYILKDAPYR